MSLILSGKNTEIASFIPKKYRSAIFNSIIAKSLTDGSLLKEVSLYLSTSELEDFIENTNISVQIKIKKNTPKEYKPIISDKLKNKDKEIEQLFSGFD